MVDLGLRLRLLVGVANELHGCLRHGDHACTLSSDVERAVHGFDRAGDHLSLGQADVQRPWRGDGGDRIPFQSYFARVVGLHDQSFGVTAKNRSGDSVPVGESNLVRPKRSRTKQQRSRDYEFHSLSLADFYTRRLSINRTSPSHTAAT